LKPGASRLTSEELLLPSQLAEVSLFIPQHDLSLCTFFLSLLALSIQTLSHALLLLFTPPPPLLSMRCGRNPRSEPSQTSTYYDSTIVLYTPPSPL